MRIPLSHTLNRIEWFIAAAVRYWTANSGTQSRFIRIKRKHECDSFKTPSRHTQQSTRETSFARAVYFQSVCLQRHAIYSPWYFIACTRAAFISIFCQLKDNHPLAALFIYLTPGVAKCRPTAHMKRLLQIALINISSAFVHCRVDFRAGIWAGNWVLYREWLNSITNESNGRFEHEVADKQFNLHMRLISNKNCQLGLDKILWITGENL
jgi:hypothetical protein